MNTKVSSLATYRTYNILSRYIMLENENIRA